LQTHFGSPFSVFLEMPSVMLAGVASMSLVIYGAKRLWGLPLEFRTHREEQQARYRRAAIDADDAARELEDAMMRRVGREGDAGAAEASAKHPDDYRVSAVKRMERHRSDHLEDSKAIGTAYGWGPSAISKIDRMSGGRWSGEEGVWFDDGEAFDFQISHVDKD